MPPSVMYRPVPRSVHLCSSRWIEDLPAVEIAIERPALNDRQLRQIGLIAFEHHLLANPAAHDLWRKAGHLHQVRQPLHFVQQRRGNFRFDQLLHAIGERIEIVRAEREVDAPVAAEGVDGDGDVGAFDIFEQQRLAAEFAGGVRSSSSWPCGGGRFADAVGNRGDLEHGGDAALNAGQFAVLIEFGEEIGKGFGWHRRRC